jgi:hypothetical protein
VPRSAGDVVAHTPCSSRTPTAARAELIHVLRLPDFDRADQIGEFWGHPKTRTKSPSNKDSVAQAGVVGMLPGSQSRSQRQAEAARSDEATVR